MEYKIFGFKDRFSRRWELNSKHVEQDYIEYLKHFSDPIPEQIDQGTLETWFNEQFSFYEIERYGRITKDLPESQYAEIGRQFVYDCMEAEIDCGSRLDWNLE